MSEFEIPVENHSAEAVTPAAEGNEAAPQPQEITASENFDPAHPNLVHDPEEAHIMAIAGDESRTHEVKARHNADYNKQLAALYEEARPRFDELTRRYPRTDEDEAAAESLITGIMAKEHELRRQYYPETNPVEDSELRKTVEKGLLERDPEGYHRSRGAQELAENIGMYEKEALRYGKYADYRESLAQLVYRHPEAKDQNGDPFTRESLGRANYELGKAKEKAEWYMARADFFDNNPFSPFAAQRALNETDERMPYEEGARWDFEELAVEIENINKLYEDDATTVGDIKARVVAFFNEAASPYVKRVGELEEVLEPFAAELDAIKEQE